MDKNVINSNTFRDFDHERLFSKQQEVLENKGNQNLQSDTLSTTATSIDFKMPNEILNAKIKKNESLKKKFNDFFIVFFIENEVLFIFNDFPQYFFDETKAQISDYGQVFKNYNKD